MLAELYQITSILSNVCVILIITWLVIKYFQFKKIYIILYKDDSTCRSNRSAFTSSSS